MREYAKMKKCKISFFFGLCVLPFEDPKQSITNDVSGKRLCNIQRKKYAKKSIIPCIRRLGSQSGTVFGKQKWDRNHRYGHHCQEKAGPIHSHWLVHLESEKREDTGHYASHKCVTSHSRSCISSIGIHCIRKNTGKDEINTWTENCTAYNWCNPMDMLVAGECKNEEPNWGQKGAVEQRLESHFGSLDAIISLDSPLKRFLE